jgi:hypothetical protein
MKESQVPPSSSVFFSQKQLWAMPKEMKIVIFMRIEV